MKNASFLFTLLCALFLPTPQLSSQNVLVSEGLSIRNDYGYEIIGRLRDRILLFRDRFNEFEVQAFDNQMRLVWSKELSDLDRKGMQVLAVVPGRNDFSVVYKVRRRSNTVLRIHKYDPGAMLIDSMTVKNYGERMFNPPVLDVVKSDDRNAIVVYNSSERGKLELVCARVDKMQVSWDKTLMLEEEYDEDRVKDMVVSNGGDYFIITEHSNRKSKLENHHFEVLRVNAHGDHLRRIALRDFLTTDVRFAYDNLNQCLVAGGLFGEKSNDRSNGSFFLRVGATESSDVVRYEAFEDKFMSILRRKDVEDDSRGLLDAKVGQIMVRQDGGLVMIAERQHEVLRGSAAGRGFWRDGVRSIVDFYYDDMFAIGMLPDGHIHWKTVLHKRQYSQDDDGTFSSYFLFKNADRLRFLFNDEIKYDNSCSEYVLTPSGAFDRNSLPLAISQNLRLRFRDGLQISASECLIPSELRNKLKLVLVQY